MTNLNLLIALLAQSQLSVSIIVPVVPKAPGRLVRNEIGPPSLAQVAKTSADSPSKKLDTKFGPGDLDVDDGDEVVGGPSGRVGDTSPLPQGSGKSSEKHEENTRRSEDGAAGYETHLSLGTECPIKRLPNYMQERPSQLKCSSEVTRSILSNFYHLTLIADVSNNWQTGPVTVLLRNCDGMAKNDYNYTVWSRLVGPTIVGASVRPTYNEESLFALDFVVHEPGTYVLEVEVRYAYSPKLNKVNYMGFPLDLESHRIFDRGGSTEDWPELHSHWLDNKCFHVHGSPYKVTITGESLVRRTADTPRCTFEDTLAPGHWKKIDMDCRTNPSDRRCFLWGKGFVGVGHVWETPHCVWAFPSDEELHRCIDNIQNIGLIGDSLIRMKEDEIRRYAPWIGSHIVSDVKKRGEASSNIHNITVMHRPESSVYIDDLEMVHFVGWGSLSSRFGHGPSAKTEFRTLLNKYRSWHQAHPSRQGEQFVYYVAHYLNDYRQPNGFEPSMSHWGASLAQELQKIGYEVFDANQPTKSRPEATHDGLHYNHEVDGMLAVMLLQCICHRN